MADDLVQETMLKAWAAQDRFEPGTSMRAWTFVILRNAYLTDMRRNRFRGEYDEGVAERILTARSDHTLVGAPYFVHDAVWADGYAWNTVAGDGTPHLSRALVSTKAAFGMWVLAPGAYTDRLLDTIREVYHGERGWYEGRRERTGGYERALSLSTNAVVLEALLYKDAGRLYTPSSDPSHYALFLTDEFNDRSRCFPVERYAWGR